jgi:hypothetical protein
VEEEGEKVGSAEEAGEGAVAAAAAEGAAAAAERLTRDSSLL